MLFFHICGKFTQKFIMQLMLRFFARLYSVLKTQITAEIAAGSLEADACPPCTSDPVQSSDLPGHSGSRSFLYARCADDAF